MGGTISHAARRELETQNILYNTDKLHSNGKEKTPLRALLTAHKSLTLADRSLAKLWKSVSWKELLSGNVSGSYDHFANLPL
jgi:hypothetical protein